MTQQQIKEQVISAFSFRGKLEEYRPYGNGHINDTYLLCFREGGKLNKYILQRVNTVIFTCPEQVMENIQRVTGYLRQRIAEENGDLERGTLSLIPTWDGRNAYYTPDGECWRVFTFVTDAVSLDLPESSRDFYQSGLAFGRFQRLLKDYPADTLHETIPHFHDTPYRYQTFLRVLEENASGRADQVAAEIAFVKERCGFMSVLEEGHKAGNLPLKVTHNDTKLNNVLLDKDTREPVCVVDLDTIMPGYAVNDFGDSIRFGASTAAEDEPDLSKVHFDISLFETYTKGFLAGCEGTLTPGELALLPEGAKMMTLECGMRFLTDFIEGDVYFKTAYAEHNLVRCRTQFKLVEEMEQQWDAMKQIVASLG